LLLKRKLLLMLLLTDMQEKLEKDMKNKNVRRDFLKMNNGLSDYLKDFLETIYL
jgi:hypothetical protein